MISLAFEPTGNQSNFVSSYCGVTLDMAWCVMVTFCLVYCRGVDWTEFCSIDRPRQHIRHLLHFDQRFLYISVWYFWSFSNFTPLQQANISPEFFVFFQKKNWIWIKFIQVQSKFVNFLNNFRQKLLKFVKISVTEIPKVRWKPKVNTLIVIRMFRYKYSTPPLKS